MREFKRLKQGGGRDVVWDKQDLGGKAKEGHGHHPWSVIDDGNGIQRGGKDGGSNDGNNPSGTTTSDDVLTGPTLSKPSNHNNSLSARGTAAGAGGALTRAAPQRLSSHPWGGARRVASPIPHAPGEGHGRSPVEADDAPAPAPAIIVGDGLVSTVGKTTRRDNNRQCIGRKPVTNFVISDFYPGRVRYIKPKLGAFVYVSSHSDTFCHISCTLDAFVSSVAEILKVDDVVNVRVVEVDLG
jgi:hypothetical protein